MLQFVAELEVQALHTRLKRAHSYGDVETMLDILALLVRSPVRSDFPSADEFSLLVQHSDFISFAHLITSTSRDCMPFSLVARIVPKLLRPLIGYTLTLLCTNWSPMYTEQRNNDVLVNVLVLLGTLSNVGFSFSDTP